MKRDFIFNYSQKNSFLNVKSDSHYAVYANENSSNCNSGEREDAEGLKGENNAKQKHKSAAKDALFPFHRDEHKTEGGNAYCHKGKEEE